MSTFDFAATACSDELEVFVNAEDEDDEMDWVQ